MTARRAPAGGVPDGSARKDRQERVDPQPGGADPPRSGRARRRDPGACSGRRGGVLGDLHAPGMPSLDVASPGEDPLLRLPRGPIRPPGSRPGRRWAGAPAPPHAAHQDGQWRLDSRRWVHGSSWRRAPVRESATTPRWARCTLPRGSARPQPTHAELATPVTARTARPAGLRQRFTCRSSPKTAATVCSEPARRRQPVRMSDGTRGDTGPAPRRCQDHEAPRKGRDSRNFDRYRNMKTKTPLPLAKLEANESHVEALSALAHLTRLQVFFFLARPQRRSLSERDPGSGGSARPDALAPPRRAATRGSRREPQARAVHLLFGAARNGDRVGAPAHRVLLRRSL